MADTDKVKVTIRLPRALVRAAKVQAASQDESIQALIERGLSTQLSTRRPR
jgi:hypothetical protein